MREELHEIAPLDWIKHIVLGVAEGAAAVALPAYFALKYIDDIRAWVLPWVEWLFG